MGLNAFSIMIWLEAYGSQEVDRGHSNDNDLEGSEDKYSSTKGLWTWGGKNSPKSLPDASGDPAVRNHSGE